MAEQEESTVSGARLFVRDLVEKIMSARAIDGATALQILADLATQLDPQAGPRKLTPGQFASAGLAEATDQYLDETGEADTGTGDEADPTALMEAELAEEPVSDEDLSDEKLPDSDASDETSELGQDLAPWKQELLEHLILARQVHGHDAQIREADDLSRLLHKKAYAFYRELGFSDEVIAARLAQRRDGSVVTFEECEVDPEAHQKAWFFRTAFWMVSSSVDPVELLREFKLPVLKRPPPQRASVDHAQVSSDDVVDDRPADALQDSDEVDEDDRDDDEPVAEEGGRFIVSSDGAIAEVDRPTVDSRNLPKPAGDKSKSEQPPFNKGSVGKSGGDRGSVERGKTSSKPQSDEAILANLPDDVVIDAIRAVLEDGWAYSSPELIRAEADRRLLQEYGQPAVA